MAIVTCKEGHSYDSNLHSRCPQCGIPGLDLDNPTKPNSEPPPRPRPASRPEPDSGTQAFYPERLGGIDPVVGWLVCVDGPNKGKDYRLHAERNFIGRGDKMDVDLSADHSLTRETHSAVISYEPDTRKFILMPGEGGIGVKCNAEPVYTAIELSSFDLIQIGNTQLAFSPFCGEPFSWT